MQIHYIKKMSIGLVLISLLSVNGFYFLLTAQVQSARNRYSTRIDLPLHLPGKNLRLTHLTLTPEEIQVSVSTYDHWIRVACRRHALDPALVKAVIHAESRFDPLAISPKGGSRVDANRPYYGQGLRD